MHNSFKPSNPRGLFEFRVLFMILCLESYKQIFFLPLIHKSKQSKLFVQLQAHQSCSRSKSFETELLLQPLNASFDLALLLHPSRTKPSLFSLNLLIHLHVRSTQLRNSLSSKFSSYSWLDHDGSRL